VWLIRWFPVCEQLLPVERCILNCESVCRCCLPPFDCCFWNRYRDAPPPAADPNAPPVQDSMKPGYQREFNVLDETKRVLDPRRHNPVKNTKKKIGVATPSGSDLKQTLKGFSMF